MSRLLMFLGCVLLLASCHLFQKQLKSVDIQSAQLEYIGVLPVNMEYQSLFCNIQGMYYSYKNNVIYLMSSDENMSEKSSVVAVTLDRNKSKVSHVSAFEIKSQNGQRILSVNEYRELLEKGKKPRYSIPFYNDIVYDDNTGSIVVMNSGTYWQYGNEMYSTSPSIHNLSEDHRLMGQFSINRMFRPKSDSLLKEMNFDVMTISPSSEKLFSMTSTPLKLENPDVDTYDTGFVRICMYRALSRSEEGQYLYPLNFPNDKNVIGRSESDYKIVNALALNDTVLWVLEGLELRDKNWEYKMYQVVMTKDTRLTSNKPVGELKRRPILKKTFLFDLSSILPEKDVRLKDVCWGPVIDKKRSVYFLVKKNCEESADEILYALVK